MYKREKGGYGTGEQKASFINTLSASDELLVHRFFRYFQVHTMYGVVIALKVRRVGGFGGLYGPWVGSTISALLLTSILGGCCQTLMISIYPPVLFRRDHMAS
jgi:hypothetical protein